MNAIVGTAGHIDHGKTALVQALTGVDADRLPEEKQRGITIDLGFAEMSAGDTHFGFVDVPGHERFVRNMLAGASGIDIVLLVVAADEGVMPQTREHSDICRLLDIKSGVVALTKSDLVDAETLELARLDVVELVAGSFLENAPIIAVSSRTGNGVDDLRDALVAESRNVRERRSDLVARLPIDRSFTVKGFGTVVTGTLASGRISTETKLELMPARVPVRVRGIQTHGESIETALAGSRTAVNLASIDHDRVSRGMTLVECDTLLPTQAFDAEIEVLRNSPRPLRSRQRVRVHLGTAEILARINVLDESGMIEAGGKGLVQIRLESPAVAVMGERFIIRSYSPQVTVAGGVVLDPTAMRHRRKDLDTIREYLASLRASTTSEEMLSLIAARFGSRGSTVAELQAKTGLRHDVIERAAKAAGLVEASGHYITRTAFSSFGEGVIRELEKAHKADPLARGVSREYLMSSVFRAVNENISAAVLGHLVSSKAIVVSDGAVRLASHTSTLKPEEAAFQQSLVSFYENAGLEVPRLDEAIAASGKLPSAVADKLVRLMVEADTLVKVTDEFYFARTAINATIELLQNCGEEAIDVPRFKELAGVSRKYAIPLLEYFDRIHVTARVGDRRVVLK